MSRIAVASAALFSTALVAAPVLDSTKLTTVADPLHGSCVPHPAAENVVWPSTITDVPDSNPHVDEWRLSFSIDGSATFEGTTHFVTDRGIPVDDSQIVDAAFKSKAFKLDGQWSRVGDTLSIVTDKPTVHSWRLIAITRDRGAPVCEYGLG